MLAIWFANITGFLTDKDWDRVVGPWGGMMISILAAAIMLRMYVKIQDQERKDKADRHREMMEALTGQVTKNDHLNERVMDLTAESIKAQARVVGAIERFDSNAQRLAIEVSNLSEKVGNCQATRQPQ
jgi:hypothetical protein